MTVAATLKQRNKIHGNFKTNACITQQLKQVLHEQPQFRDLCPEHAQALEVIMDKTSRILAGDAYFADHWHDIQGYAALAEQACDPS